jgi:diguanylate cyclase (GGDEF)-like protein/PAS domain S-box-containing protein
MINISPTVRIILGLMLTLMCLLFLSGMTGLLTPASGTIEQERGALTRLLALQYAVEPNQQDLSVVQESMRQLVEQSPEIVSVALRDTNGETLAHAGNGLLQRNNRTGRQSERGAFIHRAPVYRDGAMQGTVVVQFAASRKGGVTGIDDHPLAVAFTLFVILPLGGFLLFSGIRYQRFAAPQCVPYQVRTALDALAEGVLLLDARGRIMFANRTFASSVDKLPGALLGRKVRDLGWEFGRIHEDEFPWDTVLRLGENQTGKQLRLIGPSGITRTFTVNAAPIRDSDEYRGVMVTFDDVTLLEEKNQQLEDMLAMLKKSRDEIRRQNLKLQYLVTRDPLTDCLNRRSFFEKFEPVFETARRNEQQLACIMVDIDMFKSINDRYGHIKGDEIIRIVAQTLQASLRASDTICRYGGEEFCIILPGVDIEQAVATAWRARANIEAINLAELSGNSFLKVTASFGTTTIDHDVADFAHFIDRADQALYLSKNTGRNRVSVWDAQSCGGIPVLPASREAGDHGEAPTPAGAPAENDTNQQRPDHDRLAPLPSRKLFHHRIIETIERSRDQHQYFSLMMLDLDMFRFVNNALGITVGDELLREVGRRLVSSLRSTDAVVHLGDDDPENPVYHLSGDEFGILLTDMEGMELTAQIATRIIESLSKPIRVGDQEIKLACNIGISLYPEHGGDADSLLKNAAAALYFSKYQETNSYRFYNEDQAVASSSNFVFQNELQRALEKHEFELHYQPKIDLKSGKVVCMEALLRWRHPEFGMIPPTHFLPVAESSGLIIPIGKWVLHTACEQLACWQHGGYTNLAISVNLSAVQFSQKDLLMQIGTILDATGIAPSHLELEITEGIIMDDIDAAATTLRILHKAGMKISIDDFGTGYSSLSHLKRFPISSVKIDRSFIRDIVMDPDDAEIIKAIISMAHGMGLSVVAEGVESQAQLAFLGNLQCDEYQGFLFSPPVSQDEAGHLLRDNNASEHSKRLAS